MDVISCSNQQMIRLEGDVKSYAGSRSFWNVWGHKDSFFLPVLKDKKV
jgi:hypothetical protein